MYKYVIPEIKTQVAICLLPIFLGSVQDMERISLIPRPCGLGTRLGKDIIIRVSPGYRSYKHLCLSVDHHLQALHMIYPN